MLLPADHRLLADRIDGKGDLVVNAAGVDLDPAGLAVEDERHRYQRLQGIALRTTIRRHISFAGTDADAKIEDILDHLGRQPWAVVGDGYPVLVDADGDLGREFRQMACYYPHGNTRTKKAVNVQLF